MSPFGNPANGLRRRANVRHISPFLTHAQTVQMLNDDKTMPYAEVCAVLLFSSLVGKQYNLRPNENWREYLHGSDKNSHIHPQARP